MMLVPFLFEIDSTVDDPKTIPIKSSLPMRAILLFRLPSFLPQLRQQSLNRDKILVALFPHSQTTSTVVGVVSSTSVTVHFPNLSPIFADSLCLQPQEVFNFRQDGRIFFVLPQSLQLQTAKVLFDSSS